MAKNSNSVFGIIALVLSILAFLTPQLFIIPMLGLIFIFIVLGFVKDKSKVTAWISLVIAGLIFLLQIGGEVKKNQTHTAKYTVECGSCSVTYTNETGGYNNEDVEGYFTKIVRVQGKDFLYLSAQNKPDSEGSVSAKIEVNGKTLDHKTSNGAYSIASASGIASNVRYN